MTDVAPQKLAPTIPTTCPYCHRPLQTTKSFANGTRELRCVMPKSDGVVEAHGLTFYVKVSGA